MDKEATPARRTLEAQLNSVRFQAGVEQGRWSVLLFDWPSLYVRVTAVDREPGVSRSADFHLICDGFPNPGPFIERWAFAENTTHGHRPLAPSTGSPGFVDAMKDWHEVAGVHGGIYRAWQRGAAGHGGWSDKRPDEAWNRTREITFVMEQLYALVSEQVAWLVKKA